MLYVLLKIEAVKPILRVVVRPSHFLHLSAPDSDRCNDAVGIRQKVVCELQVFHMTDPDCQ